MPKAAHLGPVALGVLLPTASPLLLLQWREQPDAWQLPLAGFLVGVGPCDKIIFAWYLGTLAVALVLTRRD